MDKLLLLVMYICIQHAKGEKQGLMFSGRLLWQGNKLNNTEWYGYMKTTTPIKKVHYLPIYWLATNTVWLLAVYVDSMWQYDSNSVNMMVAEGHHLQPRWASYQISKIAGCACAGNAGNVSNRLQRKPLVSDPDMHHDTCVPHALAVIYCGITNPR